MEVTTSHEATLIYSEALLRQAVFAFWRRSVGVGFFVALLIAALCAKGTSVINNAEVIDRGYECVEERLRALGADIVREI